MTSNQGIKRSRIESPGGLFFKRHLTKVGGAHPPSGSYDRPRSGLQLPQANRFIPEDDWWEGGVDAYGVSIPKIGGKTGKPPNFMEHQKKTWDDLGGFTPPIFGNTHISLYI